MLAEFFNEMGAKKSGSAGDEGGIVRIVAHFLGSISKPVALAWAHSLKVSR